MFGDVFSKIYGIELVPELYELSKEKLVRFEELALQLKDHDRELIQLSLQNTPLNELIELELGDIWILIDFSNRVVMESSLIGRLQVTIRCHCNH